MYQLEETLVPANQCILYQKTLDLVRELSEGKRQRDPHRRSRIKKTFPKAAERITRRFINSENGRPSFHAKILLHFVSEKLCTAFKTKTLGRYLLQWESGAQSFATDKELLTGFSEVRE